MADLRHETRVSAGWDKNVSLLQRYGLARVADRLDSLFYGSNLVLYTGLACLLVFAIFLHIFDQSLRPVSLFSSPALPLRILESSSHFEHVAALNSTLHVGGRAYKTTSLVTPDFNITRHYDGDLARGFLFFTPKQRSGEVNITWDHRPYIFTDDNELVYAHSPDTSSNNMRMQSYQGKNYITWWEGHSILGHGYGRLWILDEEYQEREIFLNETMKTYLPKGSNIPGYMDFHEQTITERGTVLTVGYDDVPMDLSHMVNGTKDGFVTNCIMFEIDLATGETIFSWSALDHIPVNESRLSVTSYQGSGVEESPFDYFHLNSIQDLEEGYLISSRHLWSLYLISKQDGHIIWQLDGSGEGAGNYFGKLPQDAQFRWQHYARAHNISKNKDYMEISMFDNHNMRDDMGTGPSRGVVLGLTLPPDPAHPPTLIRDLRSPEEYFADSQGSYHPDLENGGQLINFGPIPLVQEYGPAGDLRWQCSFGAMDQTQSYRAFKQIWHATPKDWDPALIIEEEKNHVSRALNAETLMQPPQARSESGPTINGGQPLHTDQTVTAYVSWLGATDVGAWNIYAGGTNGNMTLVAKTMKKGFETRFNVPLSPWEECIQVGAVQNFTEVRKSNKACIRKASGLIA